MWAYFFYEAFVNTSSKRFSFMQYQYLLLLHSIAAAQVSDTTKAALMHSARKQNTCFLS